MGLASGGIVSPGVSLSVRELREVVDLLQLLYGVDFSCWSSMQLSMRLVSVVRDFGFRTLTELMRFLVDNRDNGSVYDDFLDHLYVPTTEMFRDPGFWRTLRDVLVPQLVQDRGEELRFCVANQDSGEELYSLLIVLDELGLVHRSSVLFLYMSSLRGNRVRVGLLRDRVGDSDRANFERYSPGGDLDRWVLKEGNTRFFAPDLLQGVDFRSVGIDSDLGEDLQNIDLLLCRNHFLYYTRTSVEVQLVQFLPHLRYGGYLALGIQEHLDRSQREGRFEEWDVGESIYRKVGY